MSPNNRTEYFRKRREVIGQFNIAISRDKLVALEQKLKLLGKTKTQWLNEKIDEELGQEK